MKVIISSVHKHHYKGFCVVHSTTVSVKKRKSLKSHLKGTNGGTLEPQVCLEILGNFSDKPLEGQLSDQQLGGLLVTPDFTKSDGTGLVTMRLFDTSCRWSALSGGLGGQLLSWGFTSSGLTGCLLRTGHGFRWILSFSFLRLNCELSGLCDDFVAIKKIYIRIPGRFGGMGCYTNRAI